MSFSETIFLFVLALVIFGPKKLPEIARYIGKTLAEFRRASNEFKAQIEQEITNLEVESKKVESKKQTILPPGQAPEGTASRTLNAASTENSVQQTNEEPNAAASSEAATLAASEESVSSTHSVEAATEALPASDPSTSALSGSDISRSEHAASSPVTSPTTQETHA